MEYSEAVKTIVTRDQARREIARHGGDWSLFLAECGDRKSYSGKIVLEWLGY